MSIGDRLGFRPLVGEKLAKLTGLHGIDSREHIGKVGNGVNSIAFARLNEGEVNCSSLAASFGANKQEILFREDPIFDRPLGCIVVDGKVRILEKLRQSNPVVECICYCLHQRIGRIETTPEIEKSCVQFLDQRFRVSASGRQSQRWCLSLNLSFDFVQPAVKRNNFVAQVVVFPARVGMAADLNFGAIPEQGVKSYGCVSLNEALVVFEELIVACERLVRGKVKDIQWVFSVSSIHSDFATAHTSSALSVLDLYGTIVGLNNSRSKHAPFQAFVQRFDCESRVEEPAIQGRTWNGCVFSGQDFRLAVLRQSVSQFFDHGIAKKTGTSQSARERRAGLLGSDNVLLAFGARANFLLMLKAFNRMNDFLKLVSDLISNEGGFDCASRTNALIWCDGMRHRFGRQVLIADVFLVVAINRFLGRLYHLRFCGRVWCSSLSWVESFSLWSVFTALLLLSLLQQLVELCLKVRQKCSQFGIALRHLLQLPAEIEAALVGLLKLRFHRCQSTAQVLIFFPQLDEFLAV